MRPFQCTYSVERYKNIDIIEKTAQRTVASIAFRKFLRIKNLPVHLLSSSICARMWFIFKFPVIQFIFVVFIIVLSAAFILIHISHDKNLNCTTTSLHYLLKYTFLNSVSYLWKPCIFVGPIFYFGCEMFVIYVRFDNCLFVIIFYILYVHSLHFYCKL